MLSSYINTICNLSKFDLVALLNHEDAAKYPLLRKLSICVVLVYRSSRQYSVCEDSTILSSIISVFHYIIKSNNKITIEEVNRLIKREMNIVDNIFLKPNYSVVEVGEIVESAKFIDSDQSLLISLFKSSMLEICPVKYRSLILVLLETGQLYYEDYSVEDKYFINLFLNLSGYQMTTNNKLEILDKLNTSAMKAVFLFSLYHKSQELFIYLTSMRSVDNVFLFLRTMSSKRGIMSVSTAYDILDECARTAIRIADSEYLSAADKHLFSRISSTLELNTGVLNSTTDLLSDSLDKINIEYSSELERLIERSKRSNFPLKQLSSLLNQEISTQVKVISNIKDKVGT